MLHRPFSLRNLSAIRTVLRDAAPSKPPSLDAVDKLKTAAILVPLCNVQGVAGILLQIRSRSMRSHSGEVSCPGGKVDELDAILLDTALRETTEELGIPSDRIQVLGSLAQPERSLRGDLVWPFVGFVHATGEQTSGNEDDPLPSIDLSTIQKSSSKHEVDFVFHLPLAELVNPARLRPYLFRNERPYSAIDVSDLVPLSSGLRSISVEKPQADEVGAGREGRVEVWGLTGWYLTLLSSTLSPFLGR
ncbi:hypothetical protein C8F01DRAFT_1178615 [Mycena amicta]|nr:hypothetical protein C8F01DRAFT_1178615 [Mycena amicta]